MEKQDIMEEAKEEPKEEPKEEAEKKAEEPSEETKDLARAMLMERKTSEEVAKETGLPLRSIWGLKGALARSGKIMKRTELEKQKIIGTREEGKAPFRRDKSAPELIYEICDKYGIKDRARNIIVDRCKRVPGGTLHPGDFERLLMRLDTGLKKRDEATLVAEEYELALQGMSAGRQETRRGYYPGQGEVERGQSYYRKESDYYQPSRYEQPRYDSYGRRIYPESGRSEVSRRDFEEFRRDILEGVRKEKEEDRVDKLTENIRSISEDIATLATELRNVKENPPVVTPQGESDYEKTLKHTIDRQDKRIDETMKEIKDQGKEYRDLIREIREDHRTEVKDLEEKASRAERDARSGEGYKDDTMRFADRGLNRLADVIEKKEPIKILVEKGGDLFSEERKPPEREKTSRSEIADKIPSEYLEL